MCQDTGVCMSLVYLEITKFFIEQRTAPTFAVSRWKTPSAVKILWNDDT